jgi:thymidylate synthase
MSRDNGAACHYGLSVMASWETLTVYKNASEAFVAELAQIIAEGEIVRVRGHNVKELRSRLIALAHPSQRVYVVPERRNNVFATIAETLWVLAGHNDVPYISRYLRRAADYSDDGKVWRAGYGPRLRHWHGVDQIAEVVRILRADANSRRAAVVLFDPREDFQESRDVPCNNWLHFLIREGRLHLSVAIRSNDIMWGFSGINSFEWSVLQEMMAFWTGTQVGTASYFISSLHLYDRHFDRAQRILARSHPLTLYDFGIKHPMFSTPFEHLDASLAQCLELERRMRTGDRAAIREVERIEDELLRNSMHMLYALNLHRAGAEINEVKAILNAMPPTDLRVAAVEFFSRSGLDGRHLELADEERAFFSYYSPDVPLKPGRRARGSGSA